MAGRRDRALVERRDLEGAERAVPDEGARVIDRGVDPVDDCEPTSRIMPSDGMASIP
jgi:hypothetical protein